MSPELQYAVGLELSDLVGVTYLLLAVLVTAILTWIARGRALRQTEDRVVEARAEEMAAKKLTALRAERQRLADDLEGAREELARNRRAWLAADNVRRQG